MLLARGKSFMSHWECAHAQWTTYRGLLESAEFRCQLPVLHGHFRTFAQALYAIVAVFGSLSKHDDDGNKNPANLHIWQWKIVFLHALHVHFSFFWHFVDVLVLSTTWNDLFCRCVDDVSVWWQMFNFVFSCPKRWFQFNSRTVRTHFLSIMSLNNWKMIAETRSHIFTWRSRFRRRRTCLSTYSHRWLKRHQKM